MSRPAILSTDLSSVQESRAAQAKKKAAKSKAFQLRGNMGAKPFAGLTPAEKDRLLEILALEAGLIESE